MASSAFYVLPENSFAVSDERFFRFVPVAISNVEQFIEELRVQINGRTRVINAAGIIGQLDFKVLVFQFLRVYGLLRFFEEFAHQGVFFSPRKLKMALFAVPQCVLDFARELYRPMILGEYEFVCDPRSFEIPNHVFTDQNQLGLVRLGPTLRGEGLEFGVIDGFARFQARIRHVVLSDPCSDILGPAPLCVERIDISEDQLQELIHKDELKNFFTDEMTEKDMLEALDQVTTYVTKSSDYTGYFRQARPRCYEDCFEVRFASTASIRPVRVVVLPPLRGLPGDPFLWGSLNHFRLSNWYHSPFMRDRVCSLEHFETFWVRAFQHEILSEPGAVTTNTARLCVVLGDMSEAAVFPAPGEPLGSKLPSGDVMFGLGVAAKGKKANIDRSRKKKQLKNETAYGTTSTEVPAAAAVE